MDAPQTFWSEEQAAALGQLLLRDVQQIGIVFFDTALSITGWNEGARVLTGWTAAEAPGQPTGMLFVPEDRMPDSMSTRRTRRAWLAWQKTSAGISARTARASGRVA